MTREKAYEILNKVPLCYGCDGSDGTFPYTCEECEGAFLKAFEALKVPEWIPVSERLPKEKDGKVLICMPDKSPHNQNQPFPGCEVSQRVTTGKYSEFSKRWYIGDMCGVGGDDPIAWMPLPEPPMMD